MSRDGLQTRDVISSYADPRLPPHCLKSLFCGCRHAADADPAGACGVRCGRPGGARGSSGLGPRALGRVRPRRHRCCCCYSCCWAARARSTPATCAAGRGGESCRRFLRGPPDPGSEPSAASGRAGGARGVGTVMLAKSGDPRPSSGFRTKELVASRSQLGERPFSARVSLP